MGCGVKGLGLSGSMLEDAMEPAFFYLGLLDGPRKELPRSMNSFPCQTPGRI